MNDALLELFENIKHEFHDLSVDEFTDYINNKGGNIRLEFYSVVANKPLLAQAYHDIQNYKNTAANTSFPTRLREQNFAEFKYKIDEIIAIIKSGTIGLSKKKLAEEIVNLISDRKLKTLCIEINNTPDSNVLSLAQNIGETLKWCLWYKAKQMNTGLNEKVGLEQLLDETINKSYFKSNAASRFIKDFKNNFLKTGYDMVRHSESYIPDIVLLNPALDALEIILKECFA